MKNIILGALVLMGGSVVAQKDLPIYDKVNFIKELDASNLGDNALFISSPFAKPALKGVSQSTLGGKKIKKITYLYSNNNTNPSFGQNDLSNRRYKNLLSKLNGIDLTSVEWETKVQVGCGTIPCSEKLDHGFIIELEDDKNQIQKELGQHQLEVQKSTVNTGQSNTITGKRGTKVNIPANAFVDAFGNQVKGKVEVKLQEALTTEDIVMANLSTITNKGEILQSKGMIQLTASQNGNEVYLNQGQGIEITVPTKFEEGYSYYEGEQKNGELVWGNPVEIKVNKLAFSEDKGEAKKVNVEFGDLDTINAIIGESSMVVSSITHNNEELVAMTIIKGRIGYDIIRADFFNYSFDRASFIQAEIDTIQSWFSKNAAPLGGAEQFNLVPVIGSNSGVIPSGMANTFKMKKLGWANVDCLARGENVKKIKYNVAQNVIDSLANFSISLIVPSKRIFIPGYEKKDGDYSFTHGDSEDMAPMPVGENAFIIAMGEKDGETYFEMKKVKIGQREVETLALRKTDKADALLYIKEML